jgi:tetratricopeptide (TPR) repeat protein
MKNKETKHSASQFPNIYRIITESKLLRVSEKFWFRLPIQSKLRKAIVMLSIAAFIVLIIFLFLGISLFGIRFYKNLNQVNKLSLQRDNLQNQVNFWESVSQKYGGYKDAYFRMGLLYYQLGNFAKAREENNQALLLDPNYDDAKSLQKILDKK